MEDSEKKMHVDIGCLRVNGATSSVKVKQVTKKRSQRLMLFPVLALSSNIFDRSSFIA